MNTVFLNYEKSNFIAPSSSSSLLVSSSSTSSRSSSSSILSSSSRSSSSSILSSSSRSSSSSEKDSNPSNPGPIGADAPCGGGHWCNRATFDIVIGQVNSSASFVGTTVLRAELNNKGGGNGGPDNGPGLPTDLGTPGTYDRFSQGIITDEMSRSIFGNSDKNGQVKSFGVRIVPVTENTNPHRDITWVRIKNSCDQVVYSCCLEIGGGGNTKPPGSKGSPGRTIGLDFLLKELNKPFSADYSIKYNPKDYLMLNTNNKNKFNYNYTYYDTINGIGKTDHQSKLDSSFVSLISVTDFLNLGVSYPFKNEELDKMLNLIDRQALFSPCILFILELNNQYFVAEHKGKLFAECMMKKYGKDTKIPVVIISLNYKDLTISEKAIFVQKLNKEGIRSEDSTFLSKNLFKFNFY